MSTHCNLMGGVRIASEAKPIKILTKDLLLLAFLKVSKYLQIAFLRREKNTRRQVQFAHVGGQNCKLPR